MIVVIRNKINTHKNKKTRMNETRKSFLYGVD